MAEYGATVSNRDLARDGDGYWSGFNFSGSEHRGIGPYVDAIPGGPDSYAVISPEGVVDFYMDNGNGGFEHAGPFGPAAGWDEAELSVSGVAEYIGRFTRVKSGEPGANIRFAHYGTAIEEKK